MVFGERVAAFPGNRAERVNTLHRSQGTVTVRRDWAKTCPTQSLAKLYKLKALLSIGRRARRYISNIPHLPQVKNRRNYRHSY
jgi:hypothetical protein